MRRRRSDLLSENSLPDAMKAEFKEQMAARANPDDKKVLAKLQYDKEQKLKNEMTRLVEGPALDTLDPSQQKQLVERDYDSFYLNSLKVNDDMYDE